MKFIDSAKIEQIMQKASAAGINEVEGILDKARSLKRLALEETAVLLALEEKEYIDEIFQAAAYVKNAVYGRRMVLFAPLYISNLCQNRCLYCAFKADNHYIRRKALSINEIKKETACLLERGHKRILMVSGEAVPDGKESVDYYTEAMEAIYSARLGSHSIKRVNVNCAPLSIGDFKKLKKAGIGTYQLFQETYHDATYRRVHPSGPKSDPDNRIDAVDRAFIAKIDDVGIGVLYGLYDWRFETLALLTHVEHLEKKFNIGPHTISVPRIEPAAGVEFTKQVPYPVSEEDFKKIVAVLRLSVPYTGIILSTRESSELRDELFGLGVSQISAESRTSPGGYSARQKQADAQFSVSDERSLNEILSSLIEKEFIPSFCAACYRSERTGEAFMSLARPGTIKGKCTTNALITLKEHLDDFASLQVKQDGYKLICKMREGLDNESKKSLTQFFTDIDNGVRDAYV